MMQCEPQVLKGWFFLPEDSGNRVPGVLTWDPLDGARLELIGGFSKGQELHEMVKENSGNVGYKTILGCADSKKISIWDSQRVKRSVKPGRKLTGEVTSEEWTSLHVCVGEHIGDPSSAYFSKISLKIDDLYYLVPERRFLPPVSTAFDEVEKAWELQDNGTLLMPYLFPIIGGYRAEVREAKMGLATYSISTWATQPLENRATQANPNIKLDALIQRRRGGLVIELSTAAYFNVHLDNPRDVSIDKLSGYVSPILDLVQVASFSRPRVASVRLKCGDEKPDAYLLSKFGDVANPSETHDPRKIVFTLSDISLESFLKTRERLTNGPQAKYAWSVVVGLCGHAPRLVEEHVSQAVAAAEGFDRWCLGKGDGAGLKKRLKRLYSSLANGVKDVLDFDVEKWAEEAKNLRHHVAHGGLQSGGVIVDVLRCDAIADSVHLVTYLALLSEMKIPVENICNALLNHPKISSIVYKCENVFPRCEN